MLFVLIGMGASLVTALDKMPAEKAGTIGNPDGQIAFIRSNSLWTTGVSGTGQRLVQDARNADGAPSWSPDNREIMFTRSGTSDLKSPDMLGGRHKVYDIFIAYLDSAEAGNTFWYFRPTDDLGSRDGKWMADNKIIFWKDMNANVLNAGEPLINPIDLALPPTSQDTGHRSQGDGSPEQARSKYTPIKSAEQIRFDFSAGSIKVDDLEKELLKAAIRETNGNISKAAKLVGMTRSGLRYRIERHDLRHLIEEMAT